MDGEEKPELEEEVGEGDRAEGRMEAIPRGCMLAVWWLTMIVFLAFVAEFVVAWFRHSK